MISPLAGLLLSVSLSTEPWLLVRASCEGSAHLEIVLLNPSDQELLLPDNRVPWTSAGDLFRLEVLGAPAIGNQLRELYGFNSSEVVTRLAPGASISGTKSLQPYFDVRNGTTISEDLQLQWTYKTDIAPSGYPQELTGRVIVPKGCRF